MRNLKVLQKDHVAKAGELYTADKYQAVRSDLVGSEKEIDQASAVTELLDRVKQVQSIIDSQGFDRQTGGFVPVTDLINHYDAPIVLPVAIDERLIEAAEPLQTITRAFDVVSGNDIDEVASQYIAVGALEAAEIGLGMEYPEQQLEMEGGYRTFTLKKVGVAAAIAEETIRDSKYDLIGLHVRAIGAAMTRFKERVAWDVLRTSGQTVFDNADPANSILGHTTGRGYDRDFNATISTDDLFKAWAHSANQGYPFQVIYVNPLAWTLFVRDPLMRQYALAGLSSYYGQFGGSQGVGAGNIGNGLGIPGGYDLDPSSATYSGSDDQQSTGTPVIPGYFPYPLAFVPSPLIPYDPTTQLTDMIAVSPGNVGAIVQRDPLSTGQWDDPARDVRKIKASERYGFAIANAGLGIYVFKNVKVDADSLSVSPSIQVVSGDTSATGDLSAPSSTPLV